MPAAIVQLADAVVAVARESGIRVSEARAEPGHTLERLADLTSLVDFAATYLAIGESDRMTLRFRKPAR